VQGGGIEGAKRGLSLLAPSMPPLCPQATPSMPRTDSD